jgi:hypothetical protein
MPPVPGPGLGVNAHQGCTSRTQSGMKKTLEDGVSRALVLSNVLVVYREPTTLSYQARAAIPTNGDRVLLPV